MKLIIIALSFVLAVTALTDEEEWRKFRGQHQKLYSSSKEEIHRYGIFKENLQIIREHNRKFENGESTFKMGVNQYTDMTQEEFKQFLGYQQSVKPEFFGKYEYFVSNKSIQDIDSMDWRDQGAVTDVKNQGDCGACWSFSTVGSLEGQYFLKTGDLVSLSAQNLVDCDTTSVGCNGGRMDYAFKYIEDNGIYTEEAYPYHGINETCKKNMSTPFLKISSYGLIPKNDEFELMRAVATVGPISAAMTATYIFQYYQTGILADPMCADGEYQGLNHAVLIVGYGTENGKDYWLVKNSWGSRWGENGYAKMLRNHNNLCGLASQASYPIL